VLEGPATGSVRVLRVGGADDHWLVDGGWPGVQVACAPLESVCRMGQEGVIHVRVDSGFRAVVTQSERPWTVGEPTDDDLEKLWHGRTEGVAAARQRARDSDSRVGWVRDEFMEPVLSVRLTHRCTHPESRWGQRACGHVFCPACNGWVHPKSRVAAPSASAVLLNNRKPNGIKDYDFWFGEVGFENSVVTKVAKKVLPVGKVAPLKNGESGMWALDGPGFERLKKYGKSRECFHTHYSCLIHPDVVRIRGVRPSVSPRVQATGVARLRHVCCRFVGCTTKSGMGSVLRLTTPRLGEDRA